MHRLLLMGLSSLSLLAACGQKEAAEPANETTGAMMPDTDAAQSQAQTQQGPVTAPDAGATGAVPSTGAQDPGLTTPGAQPSASPQEQVNPASPPGPVNP